MRAAHSERLDADPSEELPEVGQVAAVGGNRRRTLAEQEGGGKVLDPAELRRKRRVRCDQGALGGHGDLFGARIIHPPHRTP